MANAAAAPACAASDDSYLQELIRGSMPGPSSSRARVAPLTDDEIGWFCCGICTERRLVLDRFRAGAGADLDARCAHDFCIECVVRYIEGRVADGAVPVPCPAPECRDGAVMHPEACKKLVDMDVFDAWCVALCERAMGPARARCPYRDCGELVALEPADADGGVAAEVECPMCSRAFCLQCEEPWDERHGDPGGGGGRGGCVLTRLAFRYNWTRCPSCRAMIDKIEGCSHMVCRCGTSFCYFCGTPWSGKGCKCKEDPARRREPPRDGLGLGAVTGARFGPARPRRRGGEDASGVSRGEEEEGLLDLNASQVRRPTNVESTELVSHCLKRVSEL